MTGRPARRNGWGSSAVPEDRDPDASAGYGALDYGVAGSRDLDDDPSGRGLLDHRLADQAGPEPAGSPPAGPGHRVPTTPRPRRPAGPAGRPRRPAPAGSGRRPGGRPPDGRNPAPPAPARAGVADRPLRVALGTALVALLVIALAMAASGPSHRGRSVSTRPSTSAGDSVVTSPAPSTTASAGVAPTTVPRARAGAGCGFSFGGTPGTGASAPAPVGHCTVLEIGDSIGNDIGWGLARHVAPTSGLRLVQLDKSASGLAVPSFYDWPTQLVADVRQYQPDLVLISIGADDEQGMDVNGSAVQFPTPAWKSAYLARVRRLIAEATASGAFVLWVGLPIMQQPTYSQGIETLNSLFQQAVASARNAAFLPTWSLFANPSGAYQPSAVVNGASAGLRQSDGIHLAYTGEDVVATYVLRQIAAIYHVALTPTNPAVITGW